MRWREAYLDELCIDPERPVMRVAAVGLFLVTFAVATWAIRALEPIEPTGPSGVALEAVAETPPVADTGTARTPETGDPVAERNRRAWSEFRFPEGCKQVTVRADVPDEWGGGFTPGSKVDVWLVLHGQVPPGPAERVLSGVLALPCSAIDTLKEGTAEAQPSVSVSLALTPEQIQKLVAAEVRGKLRIVVAE